MEVGTVKRSHRWGNVKGTVVGVRLPDEVLEKMRVEADEQELSVGLWLQQFLLKWAQTKGALPYQDEDFENED